MELFIFHNATKTFAIPAQSEAGARELLRRYLFGVGPLNDNDFSLFIAGHVGENVFALESIHK